MDGSPLPTENEVTFQAMVHMEDPSQEELPHFPAQLPVEVRFFSDGNGLIFEPYVP